MPSFPAILDRVRYARTDARIRRALPVLKRLRRDDINIDTLTVLARLYGRRAHVTGGERDAVVTDICGGMAHRLAGVLSSRYRVQVSPRSCRVDVSLYPLLPTVMTMPGTETAYQLLADHYGPYPRGCPHCDPDRPLEPRHWPAFLCRRAAAGRPIEGHCGCDICTSDPPVTVPAPTRRQRVTWVRVWHNHTLDGLGHSRGVRRYHHEHRIVKVFDFVLPPEAAARGQGEIAGLVFAAFAGDPAEIPEPLRSVTMDYRSRGLRPLTTGDVITVDGDHLACTVSGFDALDHDLIRAAGTDTATAGAAPLPGRADHRS